MTPLAFLLVIAVVCDSAANARQELTNGNQTLRPISFCASESEAFTAAQGRFEDAMKNTNSSKTYLKSQKYGLYQARIGWHFFKTQVQTDRGDIKANKVYKKQLEKEISELREALKTSLGEDKVSLRGHLYNLKIELGFTKIDLRTTGKRLAKNKKLLKRESKIVDEAKREVEKAREDLEMTREVEAIAREELKRAQAELSACEDGSE